MLERLIKLLFIQLYINTIRCISIGTTMIYWLGSIGSISSVLKFYSIWYEISFAQYYMIDKIFLVELANQYMNNITVR